MNCHTNVWYQRQYSSKSTILLSKHKASNEYSYMAAMYFNGFRLSRRTAVAKSCVVRPLCTSRNMHLFTSYTISQTAAYLSLLIILSLSGRTVIDYSSIPLFYELFSPTYGRSKLLSSWKELLFFRVRFCLSGLLILGITSEDRPIGKSI